MTKSSLGIQILFIPRDDNYITTCVHMGSLLLTHNSSVIFLLSYNKIVVDIIYN